MRERRDEVVLVTRFVFAHNKIEALSVHTATCFQKAFWFLVSAASHVNKGALASVFISFSVPYTFTTLSCQVFSVRLVTCLSSTQVPSRDTQKRRRRRSLLIQPRDLWLIFRSGFCLPARTQPTTGVLCAFVPSRGAVDLILTILCSCFVAKNAVLCADRGCVSASLRLHNKKPLQQFSPRPLSAA